MFPAANPLRPTGTSARRLVPALACIGVLALAACENDDAPREMRWGAEDAPAAGADAGAAAERPDPTPGRGAADAGGPDRPDCSPLTGAEAAAKWLPGVTPRMDWAEPDPATYDPCLPLSWLHLTQRGANSRMAEHAMLFHRGEYLGTATADTLNGMSTITRIDDSTIEIAQPRANRVDRFRWDEAAGRVLMNDGAEEKGGRAGDAARGPAGAGGGAIPDSATEVSTVKPYAGGIAVLTTPSGNISCGIYSDYVRCGIASYSEASPLGTDNDRQLDTVYIRHGAIEYQAASDPGPWMYQANGGDDTIRPETVAYGRTVYYGAFACSSAQDGLTCWDSGSGAGVKMNRAGVTEL